MRHIQHSNYSVRIELLEYNPPTLDAKKRGPPFSIVAPVLFRNEIAVRLQPTPCIH